MELFLKNLLRGTAYIERKRQDLSSFLSFSLLFTFPSTAPSLCLGPVLDQGEGEIWVGLENRGGSCSWQMWVCRSERKGNVIQNSRKDRIHLATQLFAGPYPVSLPLMQPHCYSCRLGHGYHLGRSIFPSDPFLFFSFSFSYSFYRAPGFQLPRQYFSLLFVFLLIFLKYISHCSNQNFDWKIQGFLTI